jgi:hypothetical protein
MDQVSLKYINIFPPKLTQIWIFGLKTNHLATMSESRHWAALFDAMRYTERGIERENKTY